MAQNPGRGRGRGQETSLPHRPAQSEAGSSSTQRGRGDRGNRGGRGGDTYRGRGSGGDRGGGRGRGRGDDGGGGQRGRGSGSGQGRGRGGGGPADTGVFSQQDAPVVNEKVKTTEDETEKNLKLVKQKDSKYPPRPAFGSKGTRVLLWANYFNLVPDGNLTLYRYSVNIREIGSSTVPTGKKANRIVDLLLEEHFLPHMADIATDFKSNLVTRHKLTLQDGGYTVQYRAEGEDTAAANAKHYQITIGESGTFTMTELINHLTSTQAGALLNSKEEFIQALNIVLGHHPKATPAIGTIASNRHFHRTPDAQNMRSLEEGLQAIRGFFMSVRAATSRLLVNVQAKNIAVYNEGRLDALMQLYLRSQGPNNIKLAKFLRRLSIDVTHITRTNGAGNRIPRIKTIQGLADVRDGARLPHPPRVRAFGAGAKDVEFYLEGAGGGGSSGQKPTPSSSGKKGKKAQKPGPAPLQTGDWISVYNFFLQTYNITIQRPELPVINVGTRDNPSYLPAEVCNVVPGQPALAKLSSVQTQNMIRFAVRRPRLNAESIVTSGGQLLGFNPKNPTLTAFGINVNPQLITVPGRVLPPPTVMYRGPQPPRVDHGSWNMIKAQFVSNSTLDSWTYLHISFHGRNGMTEDQLFNQLNGLQNVLRQQGIAVTGYVRGQKISVNPNNIEPDVDRAIGNFVLSRQPPKLILVIIPAGDNTAIYNRVKYLCDVRGGLLNVCVLESKFATANPQYFANVSLKFNLKLGGRNHRLDAMNGSKVGFISAKKTMVVGIDVTHPSPGSASNAPSVAGIVASIDEHLGQWPADIRIQTGRQEKVDDLGSLLKSRLNLWEKNQGKLPENILVYRDGVSEGQYQMVVNEELPQLRKACEERYPGTDIKAGKPRISIVVVGKRHHTRFYPTNEAGADRSGNPKNGTVVDRVVTEARNWDFFLQAHSALQGTARPAHYYVVYDEIFQDKNNQLPYNSAADALEDITHNMCYLFGRATKAVSICPPAYYADLVCERARLYLKEYFEPASAAESEAGSSTAGPSSLPESRLVRIHERVRDSMFYI